ncbi:MAG: hypothetical protein HY370_03385 [Proteobacteria bacterium]|nr:hypothetical protein [Pseudomonadota bacterium]
MSSKILPIFFSVAHSWHTWDQKIATGGKTWRQYSIGLGPDWDKVQEIAKTDERIAIALKRYNEQIDSNIDRLFEAMEEGWPNDTASVSTSSRKPEGFLQKLKFW